MKFLKMLSIFIGFTIFFRINYAQCESDIRASWVNYLTEDSYTYTINWNEYSSTMFEGLGMSYTQIQNAVNSAVSTSFSSWGGPAGISFSPVSSGGDITIEFASIGNCGGKAWPGYMLVKFSTDSQFDFDTDFYDDDRFYFKTVALHEIGNLFIGSDHNIDTLACETYPNDCKTSAMVHTYPKRVVTSITTCDASKISEIYNFPYTVTYKNDFGETVNKSYMYIDGQYDSLDNDGGSKTWYALQGTKTLEAIDQEINTRYRLFDNWNTGWDNDKEIELPKSSGTYTAYFKDRYDIRFYNGTVVIGGNTYQSGQVYYHKEDDTFYATANSKTESGLYYVFSSWKLGASTYSTSNPASFSPNDDTDYTIEYNPVKPVWTNRNLHTNSTPGAYITVYWNEHPCDDVDYKIYRKIKVNGVMGSEVYRGYVNHGTTSWIIFKLPTVFIQC